MIEDQLKWFTGHFPDTVMPRELLRDHLTQDISPQVLDQQSSYLGNRMAAFQIAQQSLVFTCCGLAGHKMAMSVLDRHAVPMQVLQLCASLLRYIQSALTATMYCTCSCSARPKKANVCKPLGQSCISHGHHGLKPWRPAKTS